jgi:deoxyribodipyrimidine photo-lyase
VFIRRWVPELARVPLPYLAEPWKMDVSVQRMAGCMIGVDYPAPIVDDKLAMKAAKDRMYGLRKTDESRAEAGDVQQRHGSRKSGLPQTGRTAKRKAKERTTPPPQGDLFT